MSVLDNTLVIGRNGAVRMEDAQLEAARLGTFTRGELADALGLKPIQLGRFLTAMCALDAIERTEGGYRSLEEPPDEEPEPVTAVEDSGPPDFELLERLRRARIERIQHDRAVKALRDAVVALRRFTIGEIAGYLGVQKRIAQRLLDELPDGMVIDTGDTYRRSPLLEYRPPEAPKRFSRPRRETPEQRVREIIRRGPVEGVGGAPRYSNNKDVNLLVAAAIAAGWIIEKRHKHRVVVVPGDRPIPIPGTPKGPGMVRAFRDQLRNAGLPVEGLIGRRPAA